MFGEDKYASDREHAVHQAIRSPHAEAIDLSKPYWGKGIATLALCVFLLDVTVRPIYARAAKDNLAPLRVLEKYGFKIVNESKGFANARGQEIEEFLLQLG